MNTCRFCGNEIPEKFNQFYCDKNCRQRYDYYFRAKDRDIINLRKILLTLEYHQVVLNNVIKATRRIIALGGEPDDRSWIERKYPCSNNGR